MELCPKCQTEKAELHPIFGVIHCQRCRDKEAEEYDLPLTNQPEFAGESIKKQRQAFKRDIIQKYRYGELSKEWVDAYPDKARAHHTKEELKQAKKVWGNDV